MLLSLASSLTTFSLLAKCIGGDLCLDPSKNVPAPVVTPAEEPTQPTEPVEKPDPLKDAQNQQLPAEVKLSVPFTSQAPDKEWVPPFDEACEEASLLMVEFFLQGRTFTPHTASTEIEYLVAIEDRFGWEVDISTKQVAQLASQTYRRIFYRYTGSDVTITNMKKLLAAGYPIIVPAAGRELQNPNFQGEGPPYHMLVLTGYNSENFYAHDPGTQFGEHFEYPQARLYNAIHEWTGDRATVLEGEKAMLIIDNAGAGTYGF